MKLRKPVILALAVGMGSAVFLWVSRPAVGRQASELALNAVQDRAAALETVTVFVARLDMPKRTMIMADAARSFKPVRYVKGDQPDDAVRDLGKLKHKSLKRALSKDQPVRNADVEDLEAFLKFVRLAPNERPYTIKVHLVEVPIHALGPLEPGELVDVATEAKLPDGKTATETVLQAVEVIAIDWGDPGRWTVTLRLKLEQVQKLLEYKNSTMFRLAIRRGERN